MKKEELLKEISHIRFHGLHVDIEREDVGSLGDVMREGLMWNRSYAPAEKSLLLCMDVFESCLDLELPLSRPVGLKKH